MSRLPDTFILLCFMGWVTKRLLYAVRSHSPKIVIYSKEPKIVTAFDLFTFFRADLIQSEASWKLPSNSDWLIGSFSIDDGYGSENVTFKLSQTLSLLFQFAENVKCRQISLDLISWGPHSSLERERKFLRRLFTSSIKREIRHFHVVVVQQRRRNVQKSVMHVQTCFA